MVVMIKENKKVKSLKIVQKSNYKLLKTTYNSLEWENKIKEFKTSTPILFSSDIGVVYISSEEKVNELIDKLEFLKYEFNRKYEESENLKFNKQLIVKDMKKELNKTFKEYNNHLTKNNAKKLYNKIIEFFNSDTSTTEEKIIRQFFIFLNKIYGEQKLK